jgi:hypothetical protein
MKTSKFENNRRDFIKTILPTGALLCLGCPKLIGANNTALNFQDQDFSSRIKKELSFTHEQYFRNRYGYYIQRMKKLAEYMGKDQLLSMLKRATDDLNLTQKPNLEAKSVKDFMNPVLKDENYKIRLDLEILELTDKKCQLKVTNCLWAKTFRAMDAGDIGFATICYGDFSGATAFNPKLKLERTNTLMEGQDHCDGTYTWEG